MDVNHAERRLGEGIDDKSLLVGGFIQNISDAMLKPVPASLAAVMAVLRKWKPDVYATMGDEELTPHAIAKGKKHRVLQRFVPEPAVLVAGYVGWDVHFPVFFSPSE